MVYIDWEIILALTAVLLLNAILMIKTVSVKIKNAGKMRTEAQKRLYEIINRSFGNFKLIKLQSMYKESLTIFKELSSTYAKTNILNTTLNHLPRLFLEAIGFSLVISMILYLVYKYNSDASEAMATISIFVPVFRFISFFSTSWIFFTIKF